MWKNFISPGLKKASSNTSAAAATRTESLEAAQATSNILKSKRRAKVLSLTDLHGNGLRLGVM